MPVAIHELNPIKIPYFIFIDLAVGAACDRVMH